MLPPLEEIPPAIGERSPPVDRALRRAALGAALGTLIPTPKKRKAGVGGERLEQQDAQQDEQEQAAAAPGAGLVPRRLGGVRCQVFQGGVGVVNQTARGAQAAREPSFAGDL